MGTVENIPVVTLTNRLRIANFSSGHSFTFIDGTILPACDKERVNRLMLNTMEIEDNNTDSRFTLIGLTFRMSPEVYEEIIRMASGMHSKYDLVLCPLPVLNAIRALVDEEEGKMGDTLENTVGYDKLIRFVGIRVSDRISKTCHSSKFCRW